jgi:thioredoxin 1
MKNVIKLRDKHCKCRLTQDKEKTALRLRSVMYFTEKYYIRRLKNIKKFKNTIMALNIDNSNFDALVAGDKLVVIDFWAQWCGPCRALTPTIEEVAAEYEGRAIIGKCDTDSNNDIAMQFGVRNIPMLVFLKDGEVKEVHVGLIKKPELVKKVEAWL